MIKDDARAVVLAAAISSVAPEPIVDVRVKVPAVFAVARDYAPPLDLDAAVFRYRVACRATTLRRRRRFSRLKSSFR